MLLAAPPSPQHYQLTFQGVFTVAVHFCNVQIFVLSDSKTVGTADFAETMYKCRWMNLIHIWLPSVSTRIHGIYVNILQKKKNPSKKCDRLLSCWLGVDLVVHAWCPLLYSLSWWWAFWNIWTIITGWCLFMINFPLGLSWNIVGENSSVWQGFKACRSMAKVINWLIGDVQFTFTDSGELQLLSQNNYS